MSMYLENINNFIYRRFNSALSSSVNEGTNFIDFMILQILFN